MTNRKKLIAGGVAALALVAGGVGVAQATSDDDAGEQSITGSALERAKAAALEHTGGGSVTDTEVGDEESRYEVEVPRDDGSQVDVQLDERFEVVGSESDDESEDESGE